MDIAAMIADIRRRPDFRSVGMLLTHNGVVRETSRDGRSVRGLRVSVDHDRLQRILNEQRMRPGIVDIRVAIAEDRDLAVGDDVMLLIVAGRYPRKRDCRSDRHAESDQDDGNGEDGIFCVTTWRLKRNLKKCEALLCSTHSNSSSESLDSRNHLSSLSHAYGMLGKSDPYIIILLKCC